LDKVIGTAVLFTVLCIPLAAADWQPVELKRADFSIEVRIGGKLFTTYRFDPEIAKPFFDALRTPQGTVVTRDFPMGNTVPPEHLKDAALEPHQRPMYFGHGNVDGIDFWGESVFARWSGDTVFGRAKFRKLAEMAEASGSATLRAEFELVSPGGRTIGEEIQAYVFRGDRDSRLIDCEITIVANHGSAITMGDTKEGTFGIRLARELNSPPARMTNSAGAQGEKEIWGKRADWVNYDGSIGGEALGVAVLDSPRSFRHPTYWHARGYGLLSANPFGLRDFTKDPNQDGSWTIPQGKSLVFRYRVMVHHGDYKAANVAQAYREYAAQQQE
jgi:hypothetical protein